MSRWVTAGGAGRGSRVAGALQCHVWEPPHASLVLCFSTWTKKEHFLSFFFQIYCYGSPKWTCFFLFVCFFYPQKSYVRETNSKQKAVIEYVNTSVFDTATEKAGTTVRTSRGSEPFGHRPRIKGHEWRNLD